MSDEETLAVYDARAGDYARNFGRSELDSDLVRFMPHLVAGGLVLDLGCGPGAASAVMQAQGFRTDAVDASTEMVKIANKTNTVGARLGTFDDLDARQTYDGVWANFSLLHAPRTAVPGHIRAIHRALKPGGVFHIGMKTGEGEHRDRMGRHYCYFSEEELHQQLKSAGFAILETTTGEGKGMAGSVDPWVTILSQKSG